MKNNIMGIVICVVILIVGIVGICILKKSKEVVPKYSHDEIVTLMKKGLANMNNIYIERVSLNQEKYSSNKAWYLNEKYKIETDTTVKIIDNNEMKMYVWEKNRNLDKIIETSIDKKVVLNEEGYSNIITQDRLTKNEAIEFKYVSEEICQGKDCIRFKTLVNNSFSGNVIDYGEAYWIDKETGLILGYGVEPLETSEVNRIYEYANISIGNVTEEDFKLPEDRTVVIVNMENNKTE